MIYATAAKIKYGKPVNGIVYNVIRKSKSRPRQTDMSPEELAAYVAKNPKSKAKKRQETETEFLIRLGQEMEADPKHYFFRWEYPLHPSKLLLWQNHVFNPLLISLIQWWESVKHDPFSPWDARDETGQVLLTSPRVLTPQEIKLIERSSQNKKEALELKKRLLKSAQEVRPIPNPHHWQRPFGVYDSLTLGRGEYYDLLALGRTSEYTFGNPCFEELIDYED
jgi:hypothetical protein